SIEVFGKRIVIEAQVLPEDVGPVRAGAAWYHEHEAQALLRPLVEVLADRVIDLADRGEVVVLDALYVSANDAQFRIFQKPFFNTFDKTLVEDRIAIGRNKYVARHEPQADLLRITLVSGRDW